MSFRVREARVEDIVQIHKLATELLENSDYAGIEMDDAKFKRLVAMYIGSKMGAVFVVVDDKNVAQGFLLGVAEELFFSSRRVATDLCFYVRPAARFYGAFLARRFIKWAKEQKSVAEILMGISSGMGDPNRIGEMYKHMGLKHVGGLYMLNMRARQ